MPLDPQRRSQMLKTRAVRFSSTRKAAEDGPADVLKFTLNFRPPLDWDALLSFLATRAIDGVEHVEAGIYGRTLCLEEAGKLHAGWIAVAPANRKAALEVFVPAALAQVIPAVLARVKRLFDLSCDPANIAAALGPLAAHRPGLRLPGAVDGFELAVRAILGQQITVKAARTLAGRFAAAFGDAIDTPVPGLRSLFPPAGRIAVRKVSDIAALGVVAARARAIVTLAGVVASGELQLEAGAEVEATLERLRSLPGIGEWTTQYIAMRALSWPDAFPHTDYGVLKAMGEKDPRKALEHAKRWQPWRAYAVMHLWKSLEDTKP